MGLLEATKLELTEWCTSELPSTEFLLTAIWLLRSYEYLFLSLCEPEPKADTLEKLWVLETSTWLSRPSKVPTFSTFFSFSPFSFFGDPSSRRGLEGLSSSFA